eukprot:TRINITY_DN715_c0_g1_i3.p1 TRINITY_DN715_c0_g1~~TRINITY_DN715_c0_g1_i3.p1  ORF type:complete len:562 (-),score=102.73 TRINITY_DN715_c0_g1_i3:231-1916(-)
MGGDTQETQLVLEENPKWSVLLQVLREIEKEDTDMNTGGPGRILVIVKDEATSTQLQKYLHYGSGAFLQDMYESYAEEKEFRKACFGPQIVGSARRAKPHKPKPKAKPKPPAPKRRRRTKKEQQPHEQTDALPPALLNFLNRKGTPDEIISNEPSAPYAVPAPVPRVPAPAPAPVPVPVQVLSSVPAPSPAPALLPVTFSAAQSPPTAPSPAAVVCPPKSPSPAAAPNPAPKWLPETETDFCGDADSGFTRFYGALPSPYVIVHPVSTKRNLLEEVRPKYIVVYDPDISIIRQIEMYKAENPGIPVRVYFMVYEQSVEQQKYIIALKREASAFESLINEKASMIVPVNQDGKHDVPEEFAAQAAEVAGEHAGTRQGKDAVAKPKTVLVDLREFRCSLPSMLHLRGMKVVPVHLEIGDYILSPDMCVERKSISDLFGSFNTGRLYSQAEAMSRAYATPVLLIEWAATATFSLQNQDDLTDAIQINSISSKLVLLTLHFPNLRLLWSRSPAYSAEIIEMLKETQCEPNLDTIKTSAGATMEGATLEAQVRPLSPPADPLCRRC